MKILLAIAALLQVSDGVTTDFFVRNGWTQEANPFMAPLVGDGKFLLLKIVGVLVTLPLLWLIYRRFRKLAFGTTVAIVALYTFILSWNFAALINF